MMKSTTLLDTQALERVFTEELQERKSRYMQQRMLWLSLLFVSTTLLLLYILTPLYNIIR